MPELHANQIRWEAPEPQKVAFDKPNLQPLADAFGALGRAANEFSVYKAKIDDTEAQAVMNKTADEAYAELSKYEPSDDNYEPALQKYRQTLQNQMQQFTPDVQERFRRNSPTYFDELNLKADELVFEKQQKRYIQKAGEVSVLLASEVVEGKKSNEQARQELEDMLVKVDNVSAEEIIYKYKQMVQVGNIENLVAAGRYSDALKFVENPEESDTLTPQQRVTFKKTIDSMVKQEAQMREKLAKDIAAETKSKYESGLFYAMLHSLEVNDAKGFADLVNIIDNPEGYIELRDGDGKVIATVSAADIPVEIRRDALKKIRTYVQDSSMYRAQAYRAKSLAENIYNQVSVAHGTKSAAEVFANAYDFMKTPDFQVFLSDEEQEKIYDIVYGSVYRHNEEFIPYANIRDSNLLYGPGLESVSAPSAQRRTRTLILGEEAVGQEYYSIPELPDKAKQNKVIAATLALNPMRYVGNQIITPMSEEAFKSPEQVFRQGTEAYRDQFEKEYGENYAYGSPVEYLVNIQHAVMSLKPEERAVVGLQYVSDEQAGLAFEVIMNKLVASGMSQEVLGQAKSSTENQIETDQRSDRIRKEIWDEYYRIARNSSTKIELPDDIANNRANLKALVDSATVPMKGSDTKSIKTPFTIQDQDKVQKGTGRTELYNQEIKKRQNKLEE